MIALTRPPIRRSPAHSPLLIPFALILASLLSGCQTLAFFSEPQSEKVTWTVKPNEVVETHQFSLSADLNIVGGLATLSSRENDTLSDIARHYGLGYNDITLANPGLDPWSLQNDSTVLLPLQFIIPDAPRQGIVLNLANMRMFYFPNTRSVWTYPVGIGREGWNTPLGQTAIVAKKANPAWTVPESIQREHQALGDPLPKVIRSGPDNPLGYYAMPLGFKGYLIHGTNKPYGIGMQVSHGCVQLYPEDVENLFKQVDIGTPVRIVHQPFLAAWAGDTLYLEAHQPLDKWEKQRKQLEKDLRGKLKQLAAERQATLDWPKVEAILKRADGVPTPVLVNSPNLAELSAAAPQLEHPERLFGQPEIGELDADAWSTIIADVFQSETEAQKLAAMLNHQGPPIPARKIASNGNYRVLAGPFKTKSEARAAAKRIKQNFDIDATPQAPLTN